MLQRLIGGNVRLITILQPGLNRVPADSGEIDQIILNLAVNGRDAMPQGGSLRFKRGTWSWTRLTRRPNRGYGRDVTSYCPSATLAAE